MSAYVMFQFDPTNREAMEAHGKVVIESAPVYEAEFFMPPTLIGRIEGDLTHQMMAILRFPTAEKAHAWYNSQAYQDGKQVRDGELNMLITLLDQG